MRDLVSYHDKSQLEILTAFPNPPWRRFDGEIKINAETYHWGNPPQLIDLQFIGHPPARRAWERRHLCRPCFPPERRVCNPAPATASDRKTENQLVAPVGVCPKPSIAPSPALWEPAEVPHGRIEVNWHRSKVIGGQMRAIHVYTPPGYDRNSRRYAVLYLLHGANDTPAGWTDVGKVNFILDNLIAQGRAKPMIIVMPWGHALPYPEPTQSSGAYWARNNDLFQEYLLKEILPEIEKNYRTKRVRRSRAIMGLSMGGGQALRIGLQHLDLFSAVGSFSAAVPRDFESAFAAQLANSAKTNKDLDLFWIGCGRQDAMFDQSEHLSELLARHGVEHTFHDTAGHHNFALWRNHFAEVAPKLFR